MRIRLCLQRRASEAPEAAVTGKNPGPVEATIRKLGVADPGLLIQAAALDRARSGLIRQRQDSSPSEAIPYPGCTTPTSTAPRNRRQFVTILTASCGTILLP